MLAITIASAIGIIAFIAYRKSLALKASHRNDLSPKSDKDLMNQLPDEIVTQIIGLLDTRDVIRCQQLSRRFHRLARDDNVWRLECFENSKAEARRKRQLWFNAQDERLAALRDAVHSVSGEAADDDPPERGCKSADAAKLRALASWDPSYADERVDYYQEYIRRHAPIAPLKWLRIPRDTTDDPHEPPEATGVGVLYHDDSQSADKIIAPIADGSICVWNAGFGETGQKRSRGRLAGQSRPGLLTDCDFTPDKSHAFASSKTLMTEVGAVECVHIDSRQQRGLFAVQNQLHEVDLRTLQTISREPYPFHITALSNATPGTSGPVVVGTTATVHLYDPRNKAKSTDIDPSLHTELIGGPTSNHVNLSQPGPQSIAYNASSAGEDYSIWVAGRFTHLLNYDLRYFPRLRGTIHSGARTSCLVPIPHPFIPRSLDLLQNPHVSITERLAAKHVPGSTLLTAGVYKGKGSLELHGLGPSPVLSTQQPPGVSSTGSYQNRQTASSSKLLSCTPHGASIAFSDGDGNIKWVERDASTPIRSININEHLPSSSSSFLASRTNATAPGAGNADMINNDSSISQTLSFNQAQTLAQSPLQRALLQQREDEERRRRELSQGGVFGEHESGDIVQKLIPLRLSNSHLSSSVVSSSGSSILDGSTREDLLLWTGDGRIGTLSFGWSAKTSVTKDGDDVTEESEMGLRDRAKNAEQRALEDAERQYAGTLRRALESQASEARFMRGLGREMGWMG